MTPARIAYVLNIFPKISETFIAGEIAELRRRGIELVILSLLPPRDEPRHEIIGRAGLDRLVEYDASRFGGVLKDFRPDLIHAHFAKEATQAARELSRSAGVPFTFTAHGYDIHRKPPPDFGERAAAAGAVVTVSEANRNYIEKTFGVPREHIHVIPCGVDTERFCPRNDLRADSTEPLIVCVARHVPVKNLGLLLEACAQLCNRGIAFRCVMIGDGPVRNELEARRHALKLEEVVQMPGAADQDEVLLWWQQASIGVLTSENEGMPVSLMEAAACGVPVVATRVGGIPELVEDGITGILSPPGDAKALANALATLLRDGALRARMRAAARNRALKTFSIVTQVDSLTALWNGLLSRKLKHPSDPRVSDPFGARNDTELPSLAAALDFDTAWSALKRRLPRISGDDGKLRLKAIRVTRHKPGRRAVVEYYVKLRRPGVQDEKLTLVGKTRARRSGNEGYRLQDAIWNAGFQADSADGISVPEPVGVIPDFQMWFQRKVAGATAEEMFSKGHKSDCIALARRIAEAIHKLHGCGVATEKQHLMEDELRILRECFVKVAAAKPVLTVRLEKLRIACERLGAGIQPAKVCGIHRDFYAAQVIVDGPRLWLLDFDLYCQGDPGLDAGNFIGHIIEQSLRETGREETMTDTASALEERFVELAGESVRDSVHAYTSLTLARHIFLSTRFPDRAHLTEELLKLCEQRLVRPPAHCV